MADCGKKLTPTGRSWESLAQGPQSTPKWIQPWGGRPESSAQMRFSGPRNAGGGAGQLEWGRAKVAGELQDVWKGPNCASAYAALNCVSIE